MKSMARKTIIVIASRYLIRFVQLAYFILLARALSPEGFGSYGIITASVFLMGVIGNLGLRQAAVQLVGKGSISDGQAALTSLMVLPLLTVGCCLSVWWFNEGQISAFSAAERWAIWLSVACVLCISLMQGIFLGRGQTSLFAGADAGPRLLQAALVFALWLTNNLNLVTALVTFALGYAVFIPWVLLKTFRGADIRRPSPTEFYRMIRIGLVYAISLFLISLQGRVGLFFLDGAGKDAQIGNFFAAQRATEIFLDVATAAAVVLFSETARAADPQANFRVAVRTAVGIFVMFLLAGVVMAVAAPLMVNIALGAAYVDAKVPLIILSLGLAPAAVTRVMNSVLSGMGKPWLSGGIAGLGVVANILVCALAVPRWGAVGASIGLVSGQIIACISYAVICRKMFGIGMADAVPDFSGAIRKLKKRVSSRQRS